MTSPTIHAPVETLVGLGQIAAGQAPKRMKAVLGSCIGLALYHPRLKTGALAHIVLPDSAGRTGPPGKFADTAVGHMIEMLRQLDTPVHGLTARLTGGANMFGGNGPIRIGEENIKAVTQSLRRASIRVVGQDVGGNCGRRIVFDCSSGQITVEKAGQPSRSL